MVLWALGISALFAVIFKAIGHFIHEMEGFMDLMAWAFPLAIIGGGIVIWLIFFAVYWVAKKKEGEDVRYYNEKDKMHACIEDNKQSIRALVERIDKLEQEMRDMKLNGYESYNGAKGGGDKS